MGAVLEAVEEFLTNNGKAETQKRVACFIAAYLSTIEKPIPQVAREGLAVLKKQCEGTATEAEIKAAYQKCALSIRRRPSSYKASSPEDAIIHSVSCGLYYRGLHDDPAEVAEMGVESANDFEDHSAEIANLLKVFFSQSFDDSAPN